MIMAKIIYKEGCNCQKSLESIEGIEIKLLNGQKALIYPKYTENIMLSRANIPFWNAIEINEIEALKKKDNIWATASLLPCKSPAAEYVNNFYSDTYGNFGLPTLLAAMEIQDQKSDIDELAEMIDGADLLQDFTDRVWSCFRYSKIGNWLINGNNGFIYSDYLCSSHLSVPVALYR